MADKMTTTYTLKAEWLFMDGDTRVFSMKNPKSNITTAEVKSLESLILNAEEKDSTLLIGDKTGAQFRRINTVVSETLTTMILDINQIV